MYVYCLTVFTELQRIFLSLHEHADFFNSRAGVLESEF